MPSIYQVAEHEGEELYEFAESNFLDDEEIDVVQNEITEEAISVAGEWGYDFAHQAEAAVESLLSVSPLVGYLWPHGETLVMIADPCDYEAAYFADRHTPEDVMVVTGEDGFRYVDDFSSRGGMVYREKDVQFDQQCDFITRPWAEENPEDYIEFLVNSDPIAPCKFLDEEDLEELGFTQHNGEFDHGMYRSSSLDNPDKIREELEAGGCEDVVFLVTRSTPFETRWNTYVRD